MARLRTLPLALMLAPLASHADLLPGGDPVAELLDSARLWDMKGRDDLARLALEKLLRALPGDRGATARLATIDARAGKIVQAQATLRRLEGNGPVGPAIRSLDDSLRVLGVDKQKLADARLLARSGRNDEAAKAYRTLFPKGPPDGPITLEYYKVIGATESGWTEARAGYARLAKAFPQDIDFRVRLAALMVLRPATRQQAINALAEMVRQQQGYQPEVMALWRRGLLSLDETSTNPQRFRDYLVYDPKDTAMAEQLARAEAAITERYRRAHDPDEILLTHVQTALSNDKLDDADAGLKRLAASKLAEDGRVVGAQGQLAFKRGDDEMAEALFRRALAKDADNKAKWTSLAGTAQYWGLLKRAGAARDAGRYDEAEGLLHAALKDQPTEPNGLAGLARITFLRGQLDLADQRYIDILRHSPDNRLAWQGRVDIALARGKPDDARRLIADALRSTPSLGATLAPMQASLARNDADQLIAAGRLRDAMALLRAALIKSPDEVWLRYDIARLYTRMGEPASARKAMLGASETVQRESSWRYADALVLAGLSQWDDALRQLSHIPQADRDPGIDKLARTARIRSLLDDASLQTQAGRPEAAELALHTAQQLAGDDIDQIGIVADAYMQQGQRDRALALVRPALAAPAAGSDIARQLALADLADTVQLDDEAAAHLDALDKQTLDVDQANQRDRLLSNLAARRAGALLAQGDAAGAQRILQAALAKLPASSRLQNALSDALEAGGDLPAALAMVQTRVDANPDDTDARLDLARLLAAEGNRAAAREQVTLALKMAPDDDIDTRLAAVRRLSALAERAEARKVLAQLASNNPDDSRIVLQQGRLDRSESHYDAALGLFQQAAQDPLRRADAQREIDDLYTRTAPYLAAALQSRGKSGDDGLSRLNQWEAPVELRWGQGVTGRWFVQLDPVKLDAGSVPAGNPDGSVQFGKSAALAPQGLAMPAAQRAKGVAIGAGWQADDWRWDIGSTPLGFPVVDLVGGVRWSSEQPWGDTRIELSRRPLTSSLLAFAGTHDAVTGETWGGVRQAGLDARWSRDIGKMSYSASGGVHALTGRNVASNDELDLRIGGERTLVDKPDRYLSAGLALSYWRFGKNLSGYTFGQGGYYSPQSYVSVSIPFEYDGRYGPWAWTLRGAIGESHSNVSDEPWFPTRPDLQAAAGNPVFTGGSGNGFSRSLRGAVEYRVRPGLRLGLEGTLDRSAFYAPNYLGLYLRYDLGKPSDVPRFPDNPITPYTRF